MLRFFVLIFVFSIFIQLTRAQFNWNCDEKDNNEIDNMAGKMTVLGRRDIAFPINTREVKPFCKLESKMLTRVESYKNTCMKNQQKQVFSVLIYTIRSFINQFCKRPNSKRTQELLKVVPCVNGAVKGLHNCLVKYIDLLDHIATWKNFKAQVPQMCCGYYQMFSCIREAGIKSKHCTTQDVETMIDLVKSLTENVVSLLCSEYADASDKCDRIKVQFLKRKDVSNRSKSFVKPLIQILAASDVNIDSK